ncbi:MAG TPA: rRNA maturation RNase YbeY [Rhodanobacteraceae bacterium]|nr:rRNA maturation RNase YbeY [Rhodanobacteraceae bacterium]
MNSARAGRPSRSFGVADPHQTSALLVHVDYAIPRRGLPAAVSFKRWIEAALFAARHHKPAELSIRLVNAREGRALNRQYRDRDYATNVLSFPVELPPGVASPLLGDLAICAPVVAREAREQGKPLRDHYAHLTVHGVLHLLGFDHQEDIEAARMEKLETGILAKLGMPDPY